MFAPALVVVAALATLTGSGVNKTEARSVAAFHAIDSGGWWNVEVVAGDRPTVEVSGDDNIVPLIITSVKDGVLVIEATESATSKLATVVRIALPSLTSLKLSGAGTASIKDVTSSKLALLASGAGSVSFKGSSDDVTVKASGAGNVALAGKGKSLTAQASGAGNIDAAAFEVTLATVKASGAGNVTVNATTSLDIAASGAGNVVYLGAPKLSKKVSGTGSVKAKDAPLRAPARAGGGW